MASPTEILAAYDAQLRRLVPPAVPAGHEYQLLGPLLRMTGQRRGFISGVVVSAAWLEINPGTDFAGLWGGSNLPAWRGRGIYRALYRHALRWRLRVE